jgi:hypothetical protein
MGRKFVSFVRLCNGDGRSSSRERSGLLPLDVPVQQDGQELSSIAWPLLANGTQLEVLGPVSGISPSSPWSLLSYPLSQRGTWVLALLGS